MAGASPESAPLGSFEGQTLGEYRILRPIAAGGMATVYLARKLGPGGFAQNAAIKVVHPHLALQREFVEMFLDEARIISLINHPNVCRVLDFGASRGTYYLAMEYVRGETWADVLQALRAHPGGEAVIPKLSAWVLAQACEGLHAAHEAHDEAGVPVQIVHRDISPQNLLVGYDGSVRIVDFGVAHAAERSHATRDGVVKGRYGYMAPEQMRGEAVDRRADIWSVGVILREALTGGRLFSRENDAATIFAVTEQALPAWPEHVSSALRAVADRALRASVQERFDTVREMGRELVRGAEADSSSVDLSDWMGRLFADNIAQKAAWLREMIQVVGATGPHVFGLKLVPQGSSLSPSVDRETSAQRLAAPTVEALMTPAQQAASFSAPREKQRRGPSGSARRRTSRRPAWLVPAVFAGMVGIVALLVLLVAPQESKSAVLVVPEHRAETQPVVVHTLPEAAAALALAAGEGVVALGSSAAAVVPDAPAVPAEVEDRVARKPAASTPRATKRSPRAETGSVAIGVVGGWADVFLGARHLGTTPVVATLPAGVHTLLVYPEGKSPAQRVRVKVRPGEQTKRKIALRD